MKDDTENDWLTTGKIVCLQILKEEKESSGTLDDLDFQYLIDVEMRNLVNPEIMESIVRLDEVEGSDDGK
jgi:hypothetical protein